MNNQKGLIHIYHGNGKGKTTAALGLMLRFVGNGGRVLFAQFLKPGSSGELNIIKNIDNITYIHPEKSFGFTKNWDDDTKAAAGEFYSSYFKGIISQIGKDTTAPYGLLVLDEILWADNYGLIDRDSLIKLLTERPYNLEIVLTGRDPKPDLLALGDYISEIKSVSHPYQKGIKARAGIEY